MDKYSKCILGVFSNERCIAVVTECLNKEYPNVTFEAKEMGDGKYELSVFSKYNRSISNDVLHVFKNVAYVLYKYIPTIEKELTK